MKEQILTAIEERYHSAEIQEYIEQKANEALKNIIDRAFNSYGDINRAMEKLVVQNLNTTKKISVPQYNDLITKVIERQFSTCLTEIGTKKIEENMKKLLDTAPAEIKLSELVAKMKENEDESERYGKQATCIVEDRSNGYHHIYLDPDPLEENTYSRRSKHSAEYHIATDKEGNVYSLTINGCNQKDTLFTGPFYGFDKLLFNLYANGSKLIIDEDYVDLEYGDC